DAVGRDLLARDRQRRRERALVRHGHGTAPGVARGAADRWRGGVRLRRRRTVANAARGAVVSRRRFSVLVVDDHEVVQWGFRLLLGQQPWVERCLTAR